MPTLDDVYRKFGETAEAAQIIETSLGNLLLVHSCNHEGLFEKKNPAAASEILARVDRHTLGQLLKELDLRTHSLDQLEDVLQQALEERNRLFHSFYRQHNLRRNSDEGRAIMLDDLETIHSVLLKAVAGLLALDGIDVDAWAHVELPTGHLPI